MHELSLSWSKDTRQYAPHLIPTTEEKCYRFLQWLNREFKHPLLVERARLIEIDLAAQTSRYEVSSRYNVNRMRSRDELNKGRDND
ncbi:hypothetical protein IEQ34_002679 [Dendrobium chrysotoxum]|uniref:Uncharacterized protein n=1 Tax=Dendrobium chrysotoxum TaxID=161865 RepID=A0AAV7HGF1_DENCH|nr:hypothetical protein IEQ34_002679 [Dendrobium chrysotoxum]